MSTKLTSLLLVSVYKNVLDDNVVKAFIKFLNLLSSDNKDFNGDLKAYSEFINIFYDKSKNQNMYEYIKGLIYSDENIISRGCSTCIKENNQLLDTAKYELSLLDGLVAFDYPTIKDLFQFKYPRMNTLIKHLPPFSTNGVENFNLEAVINSYSHNGYGIFSCYSAFKFTSTKEIKPIEYFDSISFDDLKNYDYQQNILKQNTLSFLKGNVANNILLYGDRGCGKSSSVKALINEFKDYNLKIIQVFKNSFISLPDLFEQVRKLPLKFIIFADDLTFDENDDNFSSFKAILEGSLAQKPDNVLIYATSNRMHLVKESYSSREGDDVHYSDTVDETVSLSDRFGLMLTFSSLTKNEYLDIVKQIAVDCCVEINDKLLLDACAFSIQKGIMTPRIARQFIVDHIANFANC